MQKIRWLIPKIYAYHDKTKKLPVSIINDVEYIKKQWNIYVITYSFTGLYIFLKEPLPLSKTRFCAMDDCWLR